MGQKTFHIHGPSSSSSSSSTLELICRWTPSSIPYEIYKLQCFTLCLSSGWQSTFVSLLLWVVLFGGLVQWILIEPEMVQVIFLGIQLVRFAPQEKKWRILRHCYNGKFADNNSVFEPCPIFVFHNCQSFTSYLTEGVLFVLLCVDLWPVTNTAITIWRTWFRIPRNILVIYLGKFFEFH